MFNDEYYASCASRLDHYFCNVVHIVWYQHHNELKISSEKINKIKESFCNGLEKDIERNLKDYKEITNQTLKDFLEFGRQLDWLKKENVDMLADKYEKLRQE